MAEGFEEVEALTVVDLLRRADIGCDMVSLEAVRVTGSHGMIVTADKTWPEADFEAYDALLLPGGLRGTGRLVADGRVADQLRRFQETGRLTAAICAAPTVLAAAGILKGKRAACYPGMEDKLREGGAEACFEPVVRDGSVITSRGLGTAIPFALELVSYFLGQERADSLAKAIVYQQ